MKTKKIHYINKINRRKNKTNKSKYNKKGGVWFLGRDITGRKNVDSNTYRKYKSRNSFYEQIRDSVNRYKINHRENELPDNDNGNSRVVRFVDDLIASYEKAEYDTRLNKDYTELKEVLENEIKRLDKENNELKESLSHCVFNVEGNIENSEESINSIPRAKMNPDVENILFREGVR
jgi:hypothetical protein